MGYGPDNLSWKQFKAQQNKQLAEQVKDAPADAITGTRSNDRLDGGAGDDFLVGLAGADTFILRKGGGDDVVADFKPWEYDRVLFDFGTWSDYMVFGRLSDGQTWSNFNGTAHFSVAATDVNGDGVTDTTISVSYDGGSDSITLLGWAPADLWGQWLTGG